MSNLKKHKFLKLLNIPVSSYDGAVKKPDFYLSFDSIKKSLGVSERKLGELKFSLVAAKHIILDTTRTKAMITLEGRQAYLDSYYKNLGTSSMKPKVLRML